MRMAMEAAEEAATAGEVPVGAVIVADDRVLAVTHNRCETDGLATAHAEILAINEASRLLGGWRLQRCTLYVTLEPCSMCMGAIVNARVGRVVFAARDARAGACGSLLSLAAYPLEATPQVTEGVLAEESLALLRAFFRERRAARNAESRENEKQEKQQQQQQ